MIQSQLLQLVSLSPRSCEYVETFHQNVRWSHTVSSPSHKNHYLSVQTHSCECNDGNHLRKSVGITQMSHLLTVIIRADSDGTRGSDADD